ncbi:hypothetical protein PCANC_19222 [Puccinia coronata f. sp. avenae]|uniref:Homeobox domain-containing protein n=1 Tax=Puccinia coronata f. sp. avenae TaxID=200324 RepID=A0A2N5SK19_9BASI|nr:hypothetical protein PCANC_19222 [Puccinia coronata f. sp. avenae]
MLIACWTSTRSTAIRLRALTEKVLPSSFLNSLLNGKQPDAIPPLHFPEVGDVLPHLLQLGLESSRAKLIHHEFISTINQIDEHLLQSYHEDAPKFRSVKGLPTSHAAFIEASQAQLSAVRSQSVQKLWNATLLHVQSLLRMEAPQASSQTSTPAPSDNPKTSRKAKGRAPQFTKEQTAGLNALLAHDNQFSSEEKDVIAHELNLTHAQVNRWFCNARARKKPYSCPSRRPSPASTTIQSLSSNSTRSNTPSTSSEPQNCSQPVPQTGASPDTDMVITTSSSSSSSSSSTSSSPSGEDVHMEAYFDFTAYNQPEPLSQTQTASFPPLPQPTSCLQNPIPLDFGTLNHGSCASASLSNVPAIDPRLWTSQQPFAC